MAKKRPKYLDKETPELLELLNTTLTADDPDTDKAAKIAEELKVRLAEAPVGNVDEALQTAASMMTKALNMVKSAYDAEVSMIGSDAEDDEDEDEPEEKPAPKTKAKKDKKSKRSKPEPEDEEEDEEDEDDDEDGDGDDDEPDYDSWSQKALKAELRKRGIRVKKEMDKTAMVKALRADDAE